MLHRRIAYPQASARRGNGRDGRVHGSAVPLGIQESRCALIRPNAVETF
jgi:hypothetical protein